MSLFRVGIVIGSTRVVRAGPQIGTWVHDVIQDHLSTAGHASRPVKLELVDIGALNLPLCDEPGIPSRTIAPDGYEKEHTRAWSRRVAALDGFVFVASQHNWGIPAGLKNAIDYLFHEWKGKPAAVVTYGGHGGNKCGDALRVVLGGGLDMVLPEETVNLSFPSRELMLKASQGKEMGLDARAEDPTAPWADRKKDIVALWEAFAKLAPVTEGAKQ